jgi:hypothetical protein
MIYPEIGATARDSVRGWDVARQSGQDRIQSQAISFGLLAQVSEAFGPEMEVVCF